MSAIHAAPGSAAVKTIVTGVVKNPGALKKLCVAMSLCSTDPSAIVKGDLSRGPINDVVNDYARVRRIQEQSNLRQQLIELEKSN